MLLGKLLKFTNKKYRKIRVNSISFDSRKIKKKDIFFAIKGNQTSGTKFIKNAISKGASIIVSDKKTKYKNHKTPYLLVKDVRKSLAEASSNFYKKKPSNIIAVTGTNGKSSVANFFYQILSFNKISAASIGTLGIFSKNYSKKINLTSMDPLSLHKNLQILARNKVNHVILEASSHGLDQKRLDNLNIKTGIFTNFSQDHLDYHKNMKSYFNSKMYLFKNLLNKNSKIITDEENKEFKILKNIASKKKLKLKTIGLNSKNIKILNNSYKQDKQIIKISFNSKIFVLKIPLIGYFQIKNLLIAVLAALSCGLNAKKIFTQIGKIKPVPGRLEHIINLKNNSDIIVDFAHTPDALEQSLIDLKKQFKKKIVLVFGCGGERDKKKRSLMGVIAKKYCRKVFITDDNPRNENPKKIRNSIIRTCKKIAVDIGDRKQAIKKAILELEPNEILLVAGKGHETTQDYGHKIINFSDKEMIKKIIKYKNFFIKKNNWSDEIAKKVFKKKGIKNIKYNGVSINTKTIKKNNLFFAIKGKNNDGHSYVREAIKKGATKSIVSKKIENISKNRIVKVKNTFSSLNNLARATRNKSLASVVGITGSVGKTTTKNLISFALKNYGKVHCSPLSYNNKYGVPLSICNLKSNTEYGLFEVGMSKKKEIFNLSKIIKPEIAIITNISEAHLENFKSLKDIAKAKAEIIDNILTGGKIILNYDSKFFNFLSKKAKKNKIKIISFSSKTNKADIFLLKVKVIGGYYRLKINVKNEIFYFNTKYPTDSFIKNMLACISTLYALNLDLHNIEKKIINFKIPSGRGDVCIVNKFKSTFKFIDESYNASPSSMTSAIKNMNYYKKPFNSKKLVFLGDMLELGKKSKNLHKELSSVINRSDIDKVFVYGEHIKETFNLLSLSKKGRIFNNLNEAYSYFNKIIHNNDLLMIKGSNATGLNKFSKNIKKVTIDAI